jgi:hypothetical protein
MKSVCSALSVTRLAAAITLCVGLQEADPFAVSPEKIGKISGTARGYPRIVQVE